MGDLRHVAQITAAATAEYVEPGRTIAHGLMQLPKFHGIAVIKRIALVKLRVALARGVAEDNQLSLYRSGSWPLARKQRFQRRDNTQGGIHTCLIICSRTCRDMLACNGQRVVSMPLDKLLGGALDVGVCNHSSQSHDRYVVLILAHYSSQSLGA